MIKIKRLFKSFGYAFKGLFKTFREEQNLRIQTVLSLVILILGFSYNLSRLERSLLIIVIILVLVAEITNSAVERITDVLKPRINSYVKEIKDIMAAAVLLSSLAAVLVGFLVFWPYITKTFGQ